MGSGINYLLVVPGRDMVAHIDGYLPEAVLATLDNGRCISIEYKLRNSALVSNVVLSPVAALLWSRWHWSAVFGDDFKKPLELQWQQERRREVADFETLLRRLFPHVPIMSLADDTVDEWDALISKSEGLDALFDEQDIGPPVVDYLYPGSTYYGWLCERKYIEMFFRWVEETYPTEEPAQPDRWRGWAWVQR